MRFWPLRRTDTFIPNSILALSLPSFMAAIEHLIERRE
jgi:hypothetical protein